MGWKDLGSKIVSLGAPLLGGAVGGPGGAILGKVVANIFGGDPEDPGDLLDRLTMDSEAAVKCKQIESDEYIEITRILGEQIKSVNQTMQVESKSEHWIQYSWRPIWGIASAASFVLTVLLICIVVIIAVVMKQAELLVTIPIIVGAFTTLFSVPGVILGVSAHHRGKQKREAASLDMSSAVKILKEMTQIKG